MALAPLQVGDPSPPWWVGGRLILPFAVETHTLIRAGDLLSSLTPLLAITSGVDVALLWFVFGQHVTVSALRG